MSQQFEDLLNRFEAAVQKLESLSGGSSQQSPTGEVVPPAVVKYREFISTLAKPFCEETISLDPGLKECGELLLKGFNESEKIVVAAAKGKKPTMDGFKELLAPVVDILNKIEKLRGDSKGTPLWDHFSALNEISKCLQWLGIRDITAKYVKETLTSSQFYTMKVMREYREKDPRHMDWIQHMGAMVNQLSEYIHDNHTAGLRFNPKAEIDALTALKQGSSSQPSTPSGAVPPPPAPVLPGPPPVPSSENRGPAPDMGGMFDAIKGFKTTGLRKVTAEMKTKNRPPEEKVAVVKAVEKPTTQKQAPVKKGGEPRFELVDDKRWEISYQVKNQDIEIDADQVKMHHSVYIMGCEDSLIRIGGKVNSIFIDGCVKTSIIFDSAVASCEFVNCQSCKVQITGACPMVSLNTVDGIQIFLSQASATCPIYASKSSEMNVCISNDEDYDEIPIPELFVTRYNPKTKTITTAPEVV